MSKSNLILASITFTILQIADWTTTCTALFLGKTEANPPMAFVLGHYGMTGLLAAKVFVTVAVLLLFWMFDSKYRGLRKYLWASCVLYLAIVSWNLGHLNAIGVI